MSEKLRIGILGGGQLARMLCLEGFNLGFEMHVLSASAHDPAAQVTQYWQKGDIHSPTDVKNFFENVDVATFESEFLSESVLLQAEAATSVTIQPRVQLISELSDRLKQKTWLERFQIPTSPFAAILTKKDIDTFIEDRTRLKKSRRTNNKGTASTNNYVTVLKKRRHGYDGYGTFILRTNKERESWLAANKDQLQDFIVEEFQHFQRELALQFTVNTRGDVLTFPLVEWKAQDSRCLWVKGPVKTKFTREYNELIKKIKAALCKSKYVGTIAFEIFETSKGLLVNEVAPRVHNSGHYTIEGTYLNQFRAHLCAIVGHKWPSKLDLTSKGFAMVNILGREKPAGSKAENMSSLQNQLDLHFESTENAFIHWYGKGDYRAGRKLGHITTLADSPTRALKKALDLRKKMKL